MAITPALKAIGIEPVVAIRSKDDKPSLKKMLDSAFKKADVVISVGGVSVGEYDLVKEIFEELAIKQVFWKVAIKPGKPNYFGLKNHKLVFGLPGNPVSALVGFHLFVRPALRKQMGMNSDRIPRLRAKVTQSLKKKPGRTEFVRATLATDESGDLIAIPAEMQESHMLSGLSKANCLIVFPKDNSTINQGEIAEVMLINWREL